MRQILVAAIVIGMLANAPGALAGARSDDPLGIAVSPHTLVLGADQSGTVLVHTDIPLSTVAVDTLELNGIPASGAFADSLGHVVAAFEEADVKDIVSPPSADLTLTGLYLSGDEFSGTDTVLVQIYCPDCVRR